MCCLSSFLYDTEKYKTRLYGPPAAWEIQRQAQDLDLGSGVRVAKHPSVKIEAPPGVEYAPSPHIAKTEPEGTLLLIFLPTL